MAIGNIDAVFGGLNMKVGKRLKFVLMPDGNGPGLTDWTEVFMGQPVNETHPYRKYGY